VKTQRFILIGNYPPDGQESMLRFTELLARGLRSRGITVEIWNPRPVLLGSNLNFPKSLRKWLAYVDKWILYPFSLRRAVRKTRRAFGDGVRFHVCDHSNSPYLAQLPKNRSAITCHDVLAIRGALGDATAYCQASRMGVILQKWILKHLRGAQRIACVSNLTLRHLREVTGESQPGWKVVHNAFNAEFSRVETGEAIGILKQKGISVPQPFLLHVGSNLPRKNRRMLLQMIKQGNHSWPGNICFAGDVVEAPLAEEARALGIHDRIHSVVKPDHETLCALYSLADALVFPSFSEGFGWPLIEAQACGTPVIASNLEPLPEVTGGAALHADPHAPQAFAAALVKLNEAGVRKSLIEQGLKNAGRFGVARMIDGYLALHELNAASFASAAGQNP